MKRVIIICSFLVTMTWTTQAQIDSTCYFVSWVNYIHGDVSVNNTVLSLPSTYGDKYIIKKIKSLDPGFVYMMTLKKVSRLTYDVYQNKKDKHIKKGKPTFYVRYAILSDGDILIGQSFATLILPIGFIPIKKIENKLRRGRYENKKIKITNFVFVE